MPAPQPFLIGNLKTGIAKGLQSWMSPADSFLKADNFYISKGQVVKRYGQSVYGQLGTVTLAEAVGALGSTNYTHTLVNTTSIRRSVKIYEDGGGTQVVRDDGQGNLTGDVDALGTNTIDYTTGAIDVTFTATTTAAVKVEYHTASTTPVRGINQFDRVISSKQLVCFDSRRMSKWNPTFEYFENVDDGAATYDIWNNTNLIWARDYLDKLYITDNDTSIGIQAYDGTDIQPVTIEIDAAGTLVNSCKMIFPYYDRLVLLNTNEEITLKNFPRRARWSQAQEPTKWREDLAGEGDWNDATTNDEIIAAELVGDVLVVLFEDSIWALDYTANPNNPFSWRKINGTRETDGLFAVAKFSNSLLVVGAKGVFLVDGHRVEMIDDNIPDEVLEIDQDNANLVYGDTYEAEGIAIFAYPEQPSSATNNKMFVYSVKDKAFTTFTQNALCLGKWITGGDKTFGDYAGQSFDDLSGVLWGDSSLQAGYPIMLSGGPTGYVYQIMDDQRSDDAATWAQHYEESTDGTIIDIDLETNRLNPFIEEGFEAVLHSVQLIITRNDNLEFTVDFMSDFDSTAVVTHTVDGTSSGTKVFKPLLVNSRGQFHKMRLYYTDAQKADSQHARQRIEIDGYIGWFSRGRRISDIAIG
jgi:hypothetical protein